MECSSSSLTPEEEIRYVRYHRAESIQKWLSGIPYSHESYKEPIVRRDFSAQGMPKELRDLVSTLQRISQGQGIMTEAARAEIHASGAQQAPSTPSKSTKLLIGQIPQASNNIFDPMSKTYLQYHVGVQRAAMRETNKFRIPEIPNFMLGGKARERLGPCPLVNLALEIVRRADRLERKRSTFQEWHSSVHGVILEEALHYQSRGVNEVDFCICPDARIERKQLFPQGWPRCTSIDVALTCEADDEMKARMVEMSGGSTYLRKYRSFTINHMFEDDLMFSPVCINMQTFPPGPCTYEKGKSGFKNSDIGVWMACHFARLEELITKSGGDLATLPFLPIIVVENHEWNFMAATRVRDPKCGRAYTCIWGKLTFGSTESPLGVYQAVHGVEVLRSWAVTVYRPWFCRHALGLKNWAYLGLD